MAEVDIEKELPVLTQIAHEYKLNEYLFEFFIALRRCEAGEANNEFGVVKAKGDGLETQARWAAGSIKKNWARYNEYLTTTEDKEPVDFPEYFAHRGGPYGRGWAPVVGVSKKVAELNKNLAPNLRKILKELESQ